MSVQNSDRKSDSSEFVFEGGKMPYELPMLISLGNARDILAQAGGAYFDQDTQSAAPGQNFP